MEPELTEIQIRARELEVRKQELELQRAKLLVEFARFGFAGTLTGAIVGLVFVLTLAAISAFTAYKIDSWVLLGFTFLLLIAVVAFGFLSLWQLPRIVARFSNLEFSVNKPNSGKAPTD